MLHKGPTGVPQNCPSRGGSRHPPNTGFIGGDNDDPDDDDDKNVNRL